MSLSMAIPAGRNHIGFRSMIAVAFLKRGFLYLTEEYQGRGSMNVRVTDNGIGGGCPSRAVPISKNVTTPLES